MNTSSKVGLTFNDFSQQTCQNWNYVVSFQTSQSSFKISDQIDKLKDCASGEEKILSLKNMKNALLDVRIHFFVVQAGSPFGNGSQSLFTKQFNIINTSVGHLFAIAFTKEMMNSRVLLLIEELFNAQHQC